MESSSRSPGYSSPSSTTADDSSDGLEPDSPAKRESHHLFSAFYSSPSTLSALTALSSNSFFSRLKLLFRNVFTRSFLLSFLLGQLLALLLTATGTFSQLLSDKNVNIPTSQSFVNYLFLSLLNVPLYLRYRKRKQEYHLLQKNIDIVSQYEPEEAGVDDLTIGRPSSSFSSAVFSSSSPSYFSIPLWKYFVVSLCDVEGNYFVVLAYQFTSITSVQLLDCFSIPVVLILSFLFLKAIYSRQHLLGALLCCLGLSLLIYADIGDDQDDKKEDSSHPWLGDLLVLLGACFYAVSNISQEYVVKAFDWMEFLSALGLFGSVISGVQMAILERDKLGAVDWEDPVVWAYLTGFNLSLFVLYVLTPLLIQRTSAVFLNLSFLTSDFWSIIVALFVFSAHLKPLYFVSFSIIVSGLILFHLGGESAHYVARHRSSSAGI